MSRSQRLLAAHGFPEAAQAISAAWVRGDREGAIRAVPEVLIVAVGVAGFGWGRQATFALARYRTDGMLDTSFGDDGKLRTRVGGVQPGQQIEIVGSWASSVALQTDGRIVVAGDVDGVAADRIDGRFAVARYRTV